MRTEEALDEATEMIHWAWTIIANVGHKVGGWDVQDSEWVEAAIKFRDEWHKLYPKWMDLRGVECDLD